MRKKMLFLALALAAAAASLVTVRAEADGSYACPICTTYADGSQCCINCVCTTHGRFVVQTCPENACVPAL
ncbi:MAG TPA: hypothetical protein VGS07_26950 [Thermoanaerobaculia bacterium]|jgi:hypothetical protein|nr:hypothetical protein [Thermoanaerobaculia bacterium]